MEGLKVYFTNLDFDDQLRHAKYSSLIKSELKENTALRYLFFWLMNDKEALLCQDESYAKKYLQIVKPFRSKTPRTLKDSRNLLFWWGDLSSKEKWLKEKVINSKFTSHYIEKELGLYVTGEIKDFIASDLDSLYLNKLEHGYTGKGVVKNVEYKGKVLKEEKLNRLKDFSTLISKNVFILSRNYLSQGGQYIGTHISKRYEDFYPEVKKIQDEVFKKYEEKFSVKKIQIDSFTYEKEGQVCWRYLCEVNHRLSMGQVAIALHNEFGGDESFFCIIHKKSLKKVPNSIYQKKKQRGLIRLSHESEHLQAFFITGKNSNEIIKILRNNDLESTVPFEEI